MTDDELTIALVEASGGGEWITNHHGDDELILSGYSVNPKHLRELVHERIFPVIRERGKWEEFYEAVYDECVNRVGDPCVSRRELFDILLTLPARTLAEKCLEVLREEDPRITKLKDEIKDMGLDPEE